MPAPPLQKRLTRVSSVTSLGAGFGRVDLVGERLGEGVAAGRFAMVEAVGRTDAVLLRPYSYFLAQGDTVSFLIKDVGKGTHGLLTARAGDEVAVLGPLGSAFPPPTSKTWIVAGGVGAAPFGMLGQTSRLCALFGSRSRAEARFGEVLAELGFAVQTATEDGSCGFAGRVTALLRSVLESCADRPDRIFACGPTPMMAEVAQIASEHGIGCHVSLEARMGCGFGVCRGCAHRDALGGWRCICEDGPVYDARVILPGVREAMGVQLITKIGALEWPTPLALASGTCGYGAELAGKVDWSAVGAIFTKGLSVEPRRGHPPPRIWETPSGMLNAIGLENVGIAAFLRDKLDFLRQYRQMHGGRVCVNVLGTSVGEYQSLTEQLDAVDEVDGLELNLSCPNVKEGGIEFGRSAASCTQILTAVRRITRKFIAVKLSPAYPVGEIARACEAGGADALSVANTMPAMAIDVETRLPRLSAGSGGLSGPALRPIAVKMTFDARRATRLPIIGIGGIGTWQDAVEFFLAGASAVQIGTATFADPNAIGKIRDGLTSYLERHGEHDVTALCGALRRTS